MPRAMRTIAAIGLVVLLVLPCLIGSLSSVIAIAASLALVPLLWRADRFTELRAQPALAIFAVVFAVLALIFALTMRQPLDLIYVANFVALPLALPVALAARAEAGRRFALVVCTLCLIGAGVGVLTALYDVGIRHLVRAEGFIGNANLLPRIAVLIGFIALGGLFVTESRQRLWFYLGPVFAGVVLLLAQSRGAAIIVPALILIAIIFIARSRSTRRHLIGLGALAAVGAVTLASLGPQQAARLLSAGDIIMSVIERGSSGGDLATDERLVMYQAGWAAFRARPAIGYGWANLGNAAAEADPVNLGKSAGTRDMFHSDVINFAVAGGAIGIVCWLALLIAPALGALATPRDSLFPARLYFGLVLSVGTAISGATDLVLGYDLHTTLIAFLTAMIMAGFRDDRRAA